jgi:hypothetical protein
MTRVICKVLEIIGIQVSQIVIQLFGIFLLLISSVNPLHANDATVSANEEYERQFVLANVEFTLRHEIAHVLIWELKPPVFGHEEDLADTIAVMGHMMSPMRKGEDSIVEQLVAVADGWKLEWQLLLEEKADHDYWDLYSLDIQRYYNIVCLVYGADPKNRADVIKAAGLPIDRAEWCHEEYAQAKNAMTWLRTQSSPVSVNASNPARGKMTVQYEQNTMVEGEKLDQWLRQSGIAERLAETVTERFHLPRDVVISFENCPFPNAAWTQEEAKVEFCHPLLARFLYLARELNKKRAATADSIIGRDGNPAVRNAQPAD